MSRWAGLLEGLRELPVDQERVPSDYAARRADVETDATSDFTPFGDRVSSESAGAGADGSVFEVRSEISFEGQTGGGVKDFGNL